MYLNEIYSKACQFFSSKISQFLYIIFIQQTQILLKYHFYTLNDTQKQIILPIS